MFIALRDIRRSKTRFGLLAAAVGLLFFLVLFVNTVSGTLLDAFVGAISNSSADVLVYDENAQFTIQASRLDAETVQAVSAVPDAAAGSPLSVLSLDAEHSGRPIDISLWGLEIGAVGTPPAVTDGRLPGPGEVLFDDRATTEGIAIGDVITVAGVDLTVVGLAANASFAVLPTGYVD
ncbi:MAG: peptide ABC transporter permease, partial [Actinobacteria bacterium]